VAKERLARGFIILGLVLVVSIPAYYHWQPTSKNELHARMAESGGWTPNNLSAVVGEPLTLRLISDDVSHGFAVGQLDQASVDLIAGEPTEVTIVFTKPGTYTYYCTRWCGVNHWRMRGTIEVAGPPKDDISAKPPLYVTLGLDLDAGHRAGLVPLMTPSAWRGAMLSDVIPDIYRSRDYYLAHSPVQAYQALRSDLATIGLSDQDVWDLVAWIWRSNSYPRDIQVGSQLYSANCAACHGENGAGDGVFANQLKASLEGAVANLGMSGQVTGPANFANAGNMLSVSPAHLQGKIIRGGMGTGMPSWGAIFTEDQTWALVAYLWSFQFQLEDNP
jgi:mono/diheme cytochrome c family protein/plastocyanin